MAETWRTRLSAEIEKSGQSMRAVSLRAKCGANYLHGVLNEGKEPTFDRLLRVADALNISLAMLLTGAEIRRDEELLLRAFARMDERQRQALLDLTGLARD